MNSEHRAAIKKDLRVMMKYLILVEAWFDADYPGPAAAVLVSSKPVLKEIELAINSAAAQHEMDFSPSIEKQKTALKRGRKTQGGD